MADERREGVETSEYRPRRDLSKDVAVETLKAKGLKEGKHFTAATKGAKRYEIRITDNAYAKAVEALEVEWYWQRYEKTVRNRSAAYFQPKAVVAVRGLVKSVLERLMGAPLREGKTSCTLAI
ncbi:PaRep2b protein [Pyrobaculum aerophilum]|uniref:PaRep2b protein n=1 Tax=Pyrobaculum aerophilum TaxID=13773 RepID=UPI002161E343|nr:PaRep2b protein [Pyrobaculum aerophilum]